MLALADVTMAGTQIAVQAAVVHGSHQRASWRGEIMTTAYAGIVVRVRETSWVVALPASGVTKRD